MLRANLRKTKSALNRLPGWVWPVTLFGTALVLSALVGLAGSRSENMGHASLRLTHRTYTLDVARSVDAQEKGLGDRPNMPADRGMLFSFPSQTNQCFWMKDMRFPLDIIWVSADKKVTHIEAGLSPATYPTPYCAPAQYVIELNAGTAAAEGLKSGSQLAL